MKQTVVGVFDQVAAAQQAARVLEDKGFDHDHVHVTAAGDESSATRAADTAGERRDEGIVASIRNFFADLFGPDDSQEVGTYAEAVRRGGAVVKVDVDADDEADMAREALQQAGAVDIDERVEEWRASGWSPGGSFEGERAERASYEASQSQDDGSMQSQRFARTRMDSDDEARGEGTIPVVREELHVGKRAVHNGGVRVYSHVVEKPVEEQVELRTERAEVHRRPVDRPVTGADLDAVQDKTIEVREMSEKPVVEKTARVVEEVSVGKDVETRTETVRDTLRNTEVDVEKLADTDAGMRRPFTDSDYRRDFDTNYAATGARWEDYEPAYRYGHELASDERYADRAWDDIETDVRSDWERRNPGSAWERFKASVRHAWERATH